MLDEDSHSTDLSVSGEEGHSTILLAPHGQSYLATLDTPQNCTKILRNLTFVAQFSYFIIRPKNFFVFRATFEQLSSRKATFNFFLSNFLRNSGKLFGKSRATCGKPYQPWPINTCYCEQIQEGTTWKRGSVTYGAVLQIWLYSP